MDAMRSAVPRLSTGPIPDAAEAYAQIKKALATHDSTDWDLYYDVKDPVCDIIMAGAEEWAKIVDWRAEHYP